MADIKQAMKWLFDGHKINLEHWKNTQYIHLQDDKVVDENGSYCFSHLNYLGGWEIYEEPKSILSPQYDPREVQLNDPLKDDQDYVVWDKKGNRCFAWWDGTDKCFYPLCGHNIFALDVVKWKKMPGKDD